MPTETELPAELAALGRCQYRRLRHRDATADVARLTADLADTDPELATALRRGPYSEEEVVCPYPGMVAFGPELARFFRGRDRLVAALLSRLGGQVRRGGGPLVVVGPSGVGKSSLLRAGVLPALAAGDLPIEGSAGWPQVYLCPGADPLGEIAAQVARLGVGAQELPAAMRADPAALRRVLSETVDAAVPTTVGAVAVRAAAECPATAIPARVATAAPVAGGRGGRVVMVVDQVEELFTHGSTEADRRAMLRALICAGEPAGSDPAPAVVVLGLRADFYDRCARIPDLVPHLQDSSLVLVPAMTAAEQRQAVTAPAESVGLQVEPALADLLLAEASDQALPQLAHVLRRTFAHRQGRTLTVESYRATGGIARAVATTADGIHDSLDEPDRKLLRRLMLALVAVVDGVEDTRRRVSRSELTGPPADRGSGSERILARLIDERLVTADDGTCMLSHEALIRTWPRLQHRGIQPRRHHPGHRQQRPHRTAVERPHRPADHHPHRPHRPRLDGGVQPRRHHPGHRQRRRHHAAVDRPHRPASHHPHRPHRHRQRRGIQPRRHHPGHRQRRRHHAAVDRRPVAGQADRNDL
jgi:hypothetical protein